MHTTVIFTNFHPNVWWLLVQLKLLKWYPAQTEKNSMIKIFTLKNFHQMPAVTKIYVELFSHE